MTRWCRGISLSMPENQSGWALASSTRLTGDHCGTGTGHLHLLPGTWNLALETWHLKPSTWHLTPGTWHYSTWHWHWHLALDTWHRHSKLTRQFFLLLQKVFWVPHSQLSHYWHWHTHLPQHCCQPKQYQPFQRNISNATWGIEDSLKRGPDLWFLGEKWRRWKIIDFERSGGWGGVAYHN